MKLTEPQRRALAIIKEHGPDVSPRSFARMMWPDDGTPTKSGGKRWALEGRDVQGVARGRSMWLKGGQMLADLKDRGLLTGGWQSQERLPRYRWWLTDEAREALNG